MISNNKMKLMYFNCNSILNKTDEFYDLVLTHKLSIGLISETFLKSKHEFRLANYTVVRHDNPVNVRGGGVAIIIHKSFKFKEVYVPTGSNIEHNPIRLCN